MKNVSKIILTIVEIAIIIGVALGFFSYSQKSMEPTTIYVFSREMKTNTILTEKDFVSKQVPTKGLLENQITNVDDILGYALTTNVYSGEPIMKDHLVKAEDIDIFESMDLSNYRKFSIDASNLKDSPNNIVRGDKIDLIYVGSFDVDDNIDEYINADHVLTDKFTYSTTFLQGALVYDVLDSDGNRYSGVQKSSSSNDGTVDTKEEESEEAEEAKIASIVLALTPEQYEELAVRLETGKVLAISRFDGSQDVVSKGYIYGDSYPIKQGQGIVEFE